MAVLDRYKDSEFKNLTRSTIPLLVYWRDPQRILHLLRNELGIDDLDDRADVRFEFATKVKRPGRGKASMTDVMVTSPSARIAIEAKWTEPRYLTVADWAGTSRNKAHVRNHWLALIGRITPFRDGTSIDALVYQMLHRTASACASQPQRAIVLYQVFDDGRHRVDYASDLTALASALEPSPRLDFWLQTIRLARAEDYRSVEREIAMTPRHRVPALIRRAVATAQLFEFGESAFRRISASGTSP